LLIVIVGKLTVAYQVTKSYCIQHGWIWKLAILRLSKYNTRTGQRVKEGWHYWLRRGKYGPIRNTAKYKGVER
jgi:hypothetical protein